MTHTLLALFLFIVATTTSHALESKIFNVELEEKCKDAHALGTQVYKETLEKKARGEIEHFDEILRERKSEVDPECLAEYQVAFFEAHSMTTQFTLIEYALDIEQSSLKNHKEIKSFYKKRFNNLFISRVDLNKQVLDTSVVKKALYEYSKSVRKAIPVGRFVFTPTMPRNKLRVRTLFDYVEDKNGNLLTEDGEFTVKDGSFIRQVKLIMGELEKNTKEYMDWVPANWWGKDSGIAGKMLLKDGELSYREQKEEAYFDFHNLLYKKAKKLGIELKLFYDVKMSMLKKQAAYIDRDLELLALSKNFAISVALTAPLLAFSAPFYINMLNSAKNIIVASKSIRVSMQLRNFMVSIDMATTAANLAALTSVFTFSGFFISNYGKNRKMLKSSSGKFVDFVDSVLITSMQVMPIAAISPVLVGSAGYLTKLIAVDTVAIAGSLKAGVGNLPVLLKGAKAYGLTTSTKIVGRRGLGFIKKIPKMPKHLWTVWSNAWFKHNALGQVYKVGGKRVLDKSLIALAAGNMAAHLIADVVDRGFLRKDDEHKLFVKDGFLGLNKFIWMDLIGYSYGIVGAPLFKMKSILGRYAFHRILSAIMTPIGNVICEKDHKINWDYVGFSYLYYMTYGAYINESQRPIKLQIYENTTMSSKNKAILNGVFKLALTFPKTSFKNMLMEKYFNDEDIFDLSIFREVMVKDFNIDLSNFSDGELSETIEDITSSSDFTKWIKDMNGGSLEEK
ncbi:hypothetical protein N9O57_00010 [bacterium]|nr:hypothetical protein [bacterium]